MSKKSSNISLRNEMCRQGNNLLRAMQMAHLRNNSSNDGAMYGTQKILGYVCNIHDSKSDKLYGTIDVQEYMEDFDAADTGEGHHEGVLLSAVVDGGDCLIVPELFSPVVISQDPISLEEYVIEVAYARSIMSVSHQKTTIGVYAIDDLGDGTEDTFEETIKETGESAITTYTPKDISDIVKNKSGESERLQTPSSHEFKVGETKLTITDGKIELGGGSAYTAVLCEQLEQFLNELIQYISTATAAGSPLSTAANIASMSSKLKTLESKIIKIKG